MINDKKKFRIGLDVGSTTAKFAVIDNNNKIIFSQYRRHHTKIHSTVSQMLQQVKIQLGDVPISITATGSAGIGISEKINLPFIQEVIATTEVVKQQYPQVKTLIDIGGEDSKMIFFSDKKAPDIRMNGNCAGGTGAFIDQMASLLNIHVSELNQLAKDATNLYPVASRCGVFAKTDVQNLLSRKIPKSDIAASIFHAVAIQTMNTLARGFEISPMVMLIGGPFTFLNQLTESFKKDLKINSRDIVLTDNPALLPAWGAALTCNGQLTTPSALVDLIDKSAQNNTKKTNRLSALFTDRNEFNNWNENKSQIKVKKTPINQYKNKKCFLGIDSGSTTTKITVIGEQHELLFDFYSNNKGNPIETVQQGLQLFYSQLQKNPHAHQIKILASGVAGYGEDLIKAALGIDFGMVETIAHFIAARYIAPDVSFILDIGGQDMKAIFVKNGAIQRIELNESCSSGCGSFIETFGNSLGYEVADFANLACTATAPCDLGTRCTVFMNSKVKQSLRENATTEDIAAGLSLSVIKNALYKVLKLKNIDELGDHIVVQGGTFRNPSILRALEKLTGKKVISSDIPELMGAYGAALAAAQKYQQTTNFTTKLADIKQLLKSDNFITKQINCKGCENVCTITRFQFNNGNVFYSGNKCEKIFSNQGEKKNAGENIFEYKYNLLFNRIKSIKNPVSKIGIPRILNMYENFPFWNTLFENCGIQVVLSSPSTMKQYETGSGTVMSDSICFPAKLVHGHIIELAEKDIERIFFPMVFYEKEDFNDSENAFNCPIVSSYPDVIRSAINPASKYNMPFDSPVFTFNDAVLLKKACVNYLKQLGIRKAVIQKAVEKALTVQAEYRQKIIDKGKEIIKKSQENKELLIVLAGRPYHTDALINHKTPEILKNLGVHVISEDSIPLKAENKLGELQILPQWIFPNRIYNAAKWVTRQNQRVQFVQLNSFGCGPDAIAVDESYEILKSKDKIHTLIRMDEITSTGSVNLRLRSLIESLQLQNKLAPTLTKKRKTTAIFQEKDKKRLILGPQFSYIYSELIPELFSVAGYKLKNLPPPNKASVQYGLRYSNNEICYPATVIVGDIIKALKSGKYNADEVAVAITQTGGQCRASTYLALIKKAMVSAGFENVPVVSVNPEGERLNPQPGFQINWSKMLNITFVSALFVDSLSKLYFASVVREKQKGSSKQLLDNYLQFAKPSVLKKDTQQLFDLLKSAVNDFNQIETYNNTYPKIGVVGEIYVKYNAFGHFHITDWLIDKGIEIVMPPILDFFIQVFVNMDVNKKNHLSKPALSDWLMYYFEKKANKMVKKTNKILSSFNQYEPFHNIRDIAQKASRIVNLTNQFGEGWLIPAEIAGFGDSGVKNVISLQPFGCIANHVISKGVEKRIKDLYPEMNLLFLDFDDGTSEVNILNRLHFMMRNVNK